MSATTTVIECNVAELVDYQSSMIDREFSDARADRTLVRLAEELWSISVGVIGRFQTIVEIPENKRTISENADFETGISTIMARAQAAREKIREVRNTNDQDVAALLVSEQKMILDWMRRLLHGNHATEIGWVHDRQRYLHGRIIDAARHVHEQTDEDAVDVMGTHCLEGVQFQLCNIREQYRRSWTQILWYWQKKDMVDVEKALREDPATTQYRSDRLRRYASDAYLQKHGGGEEAENRRSVLQDLTIMNIEARQDIRRYDIADLLRKPRVDQRFLFAIG